MEMHRPGVSIGSANRAKSQKKRPRLAGIDDLFHPELFREPGRGMAEEKIATEVAGRVCAIPAEAGANVGAGEGVVLVEAMKMELGAASEKAAS
jgi:biotin carboxyl carrier protein